MPHVQTPPAHRWFAHQVEDRLLPRLESHGLVMHSVLAVHRDELVYETYWHPYRQDRQHRLYSAGKSLVALAVGVLIDDGALDINERVIDFFSEYSTEAHPWVQQMQVVDLLTMRTAHASSTYSRVADPDWVRTFFTSAPTRPPGAIFSYDTSATLVLTALVEKLSGEPFEVFFHQRIGRHIGMQPLRALRSPLGLPQEHFHHRPTWREVAENPQGVAHGGSGLLAAPRDLARIAHLMMSGGRAGGTQLVSTEYLETAVSAQTPTVTGDFSHPEAQFGYGYQFWRGRGDSWAAWGMGGQIMLVAPALHTAVIVTGDNQHVESDAQLLHDALWDELLTPLKEASILGADETGSPIPPEAVHVPALGIPEHRDAPRSLTPVAGVALPATGPFSRRWEIQPTPACPEASGRSDDSPAAEQPGDFTALELTCTPDGGDLVLITNEGERRTFPYRVNGHAEHPLPGYGYEAHTSGAWADERTLLLHVHVVGDWLAQIQMLLTVTPGTVVCRMKASAEFFAEEYDGVLLGHRDAEEPTI